MKKSFIKLIAVLMAVMMVAVYLPVIEASAATSSGSLGNNVKWTFDTNTKVITVTGSGAMKNFTKTNDGQGFNNLVVGTVRYPNKYATKVVVSEGITNIGNYALSGLTGVTSVQLPSTVTSIGSNAFNGCTALTTVNLTEKITSIGASAFKNTKFANVNMPYAITSVGDNAFSGVSGLKITCNYGDAAYNYAVKHSVSYVTRQFTAVETSLDVAAMKLKVALKLNDVTDFNAGNFTLTYNSAAVTPVENPTVNGGDGVAVVYNEPGRISVAVMAAETLGVQSLTVAEILFDINKEAQADSADISFAPDIMLSRDVRVSCLAATSDATLHSYSDVGSETSKATCKDGGVMSYSCVICGKIKTEATAKDPTNHFGGTEVRGTVAATCSVEGYSGDTYCLGCGELLSKGSATACIAHSYEDKVVAATCTEGGYTVYKCSVCGDTYTGSETSALGHDYKTVTVEATCTEQGYTTYTCSRCGDTYTGNKVAPLGHEYDENGKCIRCDDEIVVTITFTADSQLEANEEIAMVVSKTTVTAAGFAAQIATGKWEITEADGRVVSDDAAVKTGYVVKNSTTGKTYTIIILGDVSLDGKVNASDARSTLRVSAKLDSATEIQNAAADVNKDGKINASDARTILRVSAKLDPSF